MTGNVLTANFRGNRKIITDPLWQWDYGQILRFTGITLPQTFEVHFANTDERGEAKTMIGTDYEVLIPDEYLTTGRNIFVWIYLHTGEDDGETEYKAQIPINKRAMPADDPPTPQEQSAITQAIAALNSAVVDVQEAVEAADDARASAASAAASEAGVAEDADRASAAATAAESAQGAAEAAQAGAETAQTGAESARDEAAQASAAQIAQINATGAAVLESIPADYTELSADVGNLKSDFESVVDAELITPVNLLNLNDPDVVLDKTLSTTTGLPSGTGNNLTVTGFIPVTDSESYAIYYMDSFSQGIELKRVCYYNADKAYIENGYVDYVRQFTPPTGCSFARIVANTQNISEEKHGMLCVVGTASEYSPYFNPYNKYTVKNTALDTDYIRTLGGVEQVFPEWELGSYNNSWNITNSTSVIMSDYIPVGSHLKIEVTDGYIAKVYPFYLSGLRGSAHPIEVTSSTIIESKQNTRFVQITFSKIEAETIVDPNTYGLGVTITRFGEQTMFDVKMSATPNAQDVFPGEVLPQYLALVAVKERNGPGEIPATVGYLYRTVTAPYKLYYAQGKPDNIRYLCDWDTSIAGESHNVPLWYCFGMTDEGDIICVHRGEIESSTSQRVRDNPIVYPHTDYSHPVLVELAGTKPTSWISNSGDYAEPGHFFFGEYIRNGHTEANVWDVSAPYTSASNWQIIKTYQRDTNPSDPSSMVLGRIEHIHHVSRDPFSGVLYVTTGDHYLEARIDYLKDGVWGILAEANEEVCRQLNFVYTPTYIYWASDAFSIYDPDTQQMVGGAHKFFRAKRDANGLIDIQNLERFSIPYLAASIATYHVAYIKDPECILILDRQDISSNYTELPFHVWNIKENRLEYANQCKTAKGDVNQYLGFRCECCQHYPNLYDSTLSVGFSLYPNSIAVCGNPNPAIIPSQGGVTGTDSVNKNQVNSMTIEVVKK